jgi:hypothetical protein
MLKLARDQKFYWLEPFAFARARRGGSRGTNTWVLATTLAVPSAVPLLLASFPESAFDLGIIVLIAAGSGLALALALPFISQLPGDIMIGPNRIVIGREVIPFDQVSHALVGETTLDGTTFRVLSFTTRGGRSYLFGIGRKVDSKELAEYLSKAGVRESAA